MHEGYNVEYRLLQCRSWQSWDLNEVINKLSLLHLVGYSYYEFM